MYRYSVSGNAAHSRLVPLLPSEWEDCSPNVRVNAKRNDNDENNNNNNNKQPPPIVHFVWENALRKETKAYRDTLKAYSHLPNGTAILDSKWVLARLLSSNQDEMKDNKDVNPYLAALESHCFRGPDGYKAFCQQVFNNNERNGRSDNACATATSTTKTVTVLSPPTFPDLLIDHGKCPANLPREPFSFWVVKDAFSNGAGGIWVIDQASSHRLLPCQNKTNKNRNCGPLYDDHRYVAQRYAWPPVLYGQRKCHVRVYGLITSDGRAFVHKRAFLHVANDLFSYNDDDDPAAAATKITTTSPTDITTTTTTTIDNNSQNKAFQDSVHITNCCANSHDNANFFGEILADLEATEFRKEIETGETIVPLAPWFPSMKASLAALTERAMPYLSGGQGNNGFEYLGMDFILSYRNSNNDGGDDKQEQQQPVAYMLEVNAPPSQDTATGLKHAEDLHDDVIRDILKLWVFPKVTDNAYPEEPGGWRLTFTAPPDGNVEKETDGHILPSKAAIINRIRWGMVERKATKYQKGASTPPRYVASSQPESNETKNVDSKDLAACVSFFARSKYPFFQCTDSVAACDAIEGSNDKVTSNVGSSIFFENAGGSQVPFSVINDMSESLRCRNRSVVGAQAKNDARFLVGQMLGAEPSDYAIFLGCNATSLLFSLATKYVSLLSKNDEVILSTENHLSNVDPWLFATKLVGATLKWWTPTRYPPTKNHAYNGEGKEMSSQLKDLLTPKTKILAISHASNILGQLRDLSGIRTTMDTHTHGRAHLVVDGVASTPHCFPNLSDRREADWYVVSFHKLFGPHLGALCGRQTTVKELCNQAGEHYDLNAPYKLLEMGTLNYEACSGLKGLGKYFVELATAPLHDISVGQTQTPFQSAREKEEMPNPRPKGRLRLTSEHVIEAYRRIRMAEEALLFRLQAMLKKSRQVRIVEIGSHLLPCVARLPVISFVHRLIKPSLIVQICASHGIACRHGAFLSNPYLLSDFDVDPEEGVVRLSLLHYNNYSEIEKVQSIFESIPGWF